MGHNPAIRQAVKTTRQYWHNCTFNRLKEEAKDDHRQALNEIIKKGYTWGLKHPLPFDWSQFDVGEIVAVRNTLFPRRSSEHFKKSDYSKTEKN